MIKGRQRRNVCGRISVSLLATAILLAWLMAGCSQTVQSQPAVAQQVESGQAAPAVSGFFGNDLSLLRPGREGQAAFVYINPNVRWSKYNKVLLEPVEFWDAANSSVSPADQQMLTTYFYNALKENLERHVTIVDQPGPGTITLEVALTNATAATPGLRSISVVVPQARILNGIQSLATVAMW